VGQTDFIGKSSGPWGLFHPEKLEKPFINMCFIETSLSSQNRQEIPGDENRSNRPNSVSSCEIIEKVSELVLILPFSFRRMSG
jgi:hypothetical protein